MKSLRLDPVVWAALSCWIALAQSSRIGQISGRVQDMASAPIKGASVRLLSLTRVLQTRSTSDGAFQFGGLEKGAYAIEITTLGFARKTIPISLQQSDSHETVLAVLNVGNVPDMEKCGREVSITYNDPDVAGSNFAGILRDYFEHTPIARAEIVVVSQSGLRVAVQSDQTGQFAVPQLKPDYYGIHISHKGYENEELTHVAVPRENKVRIESTLRRRSQMVACQ